MIRKRVLLGLDTASLAAAMTVFANEKKFQLTVIKDCDKAVGGIMGEAPDMAILDMSVGDETCCRRLKNTISPATLVVLLVSVDHPEDICRCLDGRCDAIIVKPLSYERLAGLVTWLLFPESNSASRFLVRIPVRYGIDPDSLTENHSVDLTSHGMFIQTQDCMPVGTTLYLFFTLAASPAVTIRCTARVAWLNDPMRRRASLLPPGMGLEFIHMAPLHINAIRDFLFFRRLEGKVAH